MDRSVNYEYCKVLHAQNPWKILVFSLVTWYLWFHSILINYIINNWYIFNHHISNHYIFQIGYMHFFEIQIVASSNQCNDLNTSSMGNMLVYYHFNLILLKLIFNRKHITQRGEKKLMSFFIILDCTISVLFSVFIMFRIFLIDEICFLYFELLVIWQYWHTHIFFISIISDGNE